MLNLRRFQFVLFTLVIIPNPKLFPLTCIHSLNFIHSMLKHLIEGIDLILNFWHLFKKKKKEKVSASLAALYPVLFSITITFPLPPFLLLPNSKQKWIYFSWYFINVDFQIFSYIYCHP